MQIRGGQIKQKHLWCELPSMFHSSMDAFYCSLIGCSHSSSLLCRCPQPTRVGLKVPCALFKNLSQTLAALQSKCRHNQPPTPHSWAMVSISGNRWMGCVIGAVFCALLTSSLFGASGGAVAATASSLIGVVVSLKTSDTSWVITSCMRCLRSWMKQRLLHKSTRGSSAPALSMKSTLLSLTLCILSPHAFVILAAPLDQTEIF